MCAIPSRGSCRCSHRIFGPTAGDDRDFPQHVGTRVFTLPGKVSVVATIRASARFFNERSNAIDVKSVEDAQH
jgi:hypothetical protein